MQIQKLLTLVDKLDAKLAVLFCHHNADPDAIGAAFAFSGLLNRLRPNLITEIVAATGPSMLSKAVMSHLPIKLTSCPRIEEADLIILLDTNTIQQLAGWSEKLPAGCPLVIVDHHAIHPETERITTLLIADDTASSTCEVVYRLFKEAKLEPSLDEATALFLGIAFDTRHFILATSETLKTVAELAGVGVNPQEILPILILPMAHSERVARLKAGARINLLTLNHWLIVLSNVSAYQASAARGLVALGANVAIVAGKKADELQVSFRASRDFYLETGIHMGRDLAKPLGDFLGGMGGGHSVSAGANGAGNVDACLNFCAKLLKEKIET
jgi:phosphoesterase RecJ-like protein